MTSKYVNIDNSSDNIFLLAYIIIPKLFTTTLYTRNIYLCHLHWRYHFANCYNVWCMTYSNANFAAICLRWYTNCLYLISRIIFHSIWCLFYCTFTVYLYIVRPERPMRPCFPWTCLFVCLLCLVNFALQQFIKSKSVVSVAPIYKQSILTCFIRWKLEYEGFISDIIGV